MVPMKGTMYWVPKEVVYDAGGRRVHKDVPIVTWDEMSNQNLLTIIRIIYDISMEKVWRHWYVLKGEPW